MKQKKRKEHVLDTSDDFNCFSNKARTCVYSIISNVFRLKALNIIMLTGKKNHLIIMHHGTMTFLYLKGNHLAKGQNKCRHFHILC